MKTIVVGYDGLPTSDRALDRAIELAKALEARLHIVSVGEFIPIVEPVAPTALAAPGLMEMPPWSAGAGGEELADRMLDKARERVGRTDAEVEYTRLTGLPDEALIQEADRVDADLIVVGTREPGFLDRLFGGDTSVDITRRAHRDVLIVHAPPKRET
jgi:nucleotide-binding universal stress UspA family protein